MKSIRLKFKELGGGADAPWIMTTLGDVSIDHYQGINTTADKVVYKEIGYSILQAKHITNEVLDFSDSRKLQQEDYERYKRKYKPDVDDLLISNIGTLGKIVLVESDVDFLIAWNIFKVKLDKTKVFPKFIAYELRKLVLDGLFESIKTGNATKFINKNEMLAIQLWLPSINEQTKIANFLTAIDAKISQFTKKHELLTLYKKGVMQKIFSQELRFKDDDGREFAEWEHKPISETLTIGSGRDYKHLGPGLIPVYGTGGFMLSVDDFLYDGVSVCIGRKGTIDKPVLLSGKFWTVDTLFYTHNFIKCIPEFIYACFQTINWKQYCEASGVPSLSKSTIEKIEINLPCIQEQTKIANFLTAIDDKITNVKSQLEAAKEYKQGLLQQMFV